MGPLHCNTWCSNRFYTVSVLQSWILCQSVKGIFLNRFLAGVKCVFWRFLKEKEELNKAAEKKKTDDLTEDVINEENDEIDEGEEGENEDVEDEEEEEEEPKVEEVSEPFF